MSDSLVLAIVFLFSALVLGVVALALREKDEPVQLKLKSAPGTMQLQVGDSGDRQQPDAAPESIVAARASAHAEPQASAGNNHAAR